MDEQLPERARHTMNRQQWRAVRILARGPVVNGRRQVSASSIQKCSRLLGIDTLSARLTLEAARPKPKRQRWSHPRRARLYDDIPIETRIQRLKTKLKARGADVPGLTDG